MRPELSVIIVTYQSQDDIEDCLRSVLLSSVRCELIVIDNASTDHTVERVRGVLAQRADCRLICNTENVGFAKAVNLGIAAAGANYILLLNPDCVLEQATMAIALTALRDNRSAGAAGCMLLNEDGSEQAGARRYLPTPWRALVRAFLLQRIFPNNPRFRGFLMNQEPVPDRPIEVEATSGAFMLVRRAVIDAIGPLDEIYFMHCEDIDWCVRMRTAGWQVLFVPSARALHKKGRSSRARPIRVELYKHRGMVLFYRKFFSHRYPGVLMALVEAAVWARFAIKAAAMLVTMAGTRMATPVSRLPVALDEATLESRQATQRSVR